MLISEAFELYRRDVIVFQNQSPKTEESHTATLKRSLEYFGDVNIDTLTFVDIREWKAHLSKSRGDATVREYIIKFRNVLRHLKSCGVVCLNYEAISIPKRVERVPQFLDSCQVAELIRRALRRKVKGQATILRYRNAALLSVLWASGIRASELLQLDKSDIREDGTFTVVGKGRKPRLCFLDQRARTHVRNYLEERTDNCPALFISHQTGQRLSKSQLQNVFALFNTLADFAFPIHPHTVRHSFATDMLRNNVNMRYVQEMLGHSSIQTTQMYSHVTNIDLRRVYEAGRKTKNRGVH